MGTQTTLTIFISMTWRYYLGHQEKCSFWWWCCYNIERTKYEEIWSSTSTVRFKWVFCNVMCEGKRKWWDMKTVVRLEYAKVLNMISVKLTMRFKRNGRMNPLFVIVTRTPNVIPCLIRHVLSKIVLNHICGAHSVSNLQSPFPSPFDSLLLVFPFY